MNKAMQAMTERHSEIARARFLRYIEEPITQADLLTDLGLLALCADTGEATARDEAERLLLRYIHDPAITAAYYEVRRRCV